MAMVPFTWIFMAPTNNDLFHLDGLSTLSPIELESVNPPLHAIKGYVSVQATSCDAHCRHINMAVVIHTYPNQQRSISLRWTEHPVSYWTRIRERYRDKMVLVTFYGILHEAVYDESNHFKVISVSNYTPRSCSNLEKLSTLSPIELESVNGIVIRWSWLHLFRCLFPMAGIQNLWHFARSCVWRIKPL
jgi:hypothetical protein